MTDAVAAEVRKALAAARKLRRPAAALRAATSRAERLVSDRTVLEALLFAEPAEPLRDLLEALLPRDSATRARIRGVRRQLHEPIPPPAHPTQARDALHRELTLTRPRLVHDAARSDTRPDTAGVGPQSRLRRAPFAASPASASSLGALRDHIRRMPVTVAGRAREVTPTQAASEGGAASPAAPFKERLIASAGDRRLSPASRRPTTGRRTLADTPDVERRARYLEEAGRDGAVIDHSSPDPGWMRSVESPGLDPLTILSANPRPAGLAVPSGIVPSVVSGSGASTSPTDESDTRPEWSDPPSPVATATAVPPDTPRHAQDEPWIPAPITPRTAKAAVEREDEDVLFEEAYRHGIDLT